MSRRIDTQAHIFEIQAWSLRLTLEDFEGDDWRFRPHEMNHALWILGHILTNRKGLGNIIGMDEGLTDRDKLFDFGTMPGDVPDDVAGEDLLAEYLALHGRFVEHLDGMTDADLAVATEVQFPETPQTRLGAIQFLLMHEAYHCGQLGALRVMLGKGSWLKKMAGG